jgi:PEP-CTERM motif
MGIRSIGLCVLFATASAAEAGSIWQWTHQASGGGTANVFDGEPPESAFDETAGPDDPWMFFVANDRTQVGSFGAGASSSGQSRILGDSDDAFGVLLTSRTGYLPSAFAGGDNPGGEAEGSLSSVIEFVAPVDDLTWSYLLDIDLDPTNAFSGSTDIVLENLTQSTVFQFPIDDTVGLVGFTFDSDAGDIIRLTAEMSGSGGMGPGTGRVYNVFFQLQVDVPEPGTLSLLLAGVALTRRRRRASAVPIRLAAPVIGGVA